MNWKNLLTLLIGILIGGSLGTAALTAAGILDVAGSVKAAFDGESTFTPRVGVKAPEISLKNLEGKTVRISQFRPKPVLINFWATWCPPCRDEMPLIQAASKQYGQNMVVVGINFDEPADTVQPFITENGITFPILLDPGGRVGDGYRVYAFPTTIILDGKGIIQVVHVGQLREEDLSRYLAQIEVDR